MALFALACGPGVEEASEEEAQRVRLLDYVADADITWPNPVPDEIVRRPGRTACGDLSAYARRVLMKGREV